VVQDGRVRGARRAIPARDQHDGGDDDRERDGQCDQSAP
jgi:hypothetical protein